MSTTVNWAHLGAETGNSNVSYDSQLSFGNVLLKDIAFGQDDKQYIIPMQNVPLYEAQSPFDPIGWCLVRGSVSNSLLGDLTNTQGEQVVTEITIYHDKMMELTGQNNNFAFETTKPLTGSKIQVEYKEKLQPDFSTGYEWVNATQTNKTEPIKVLVTFENSGIEQPMHIHLNDLQVVENA